MAKKGELNDIDIYFESEIAIKSMLFLNVSQSHNRLLQCSIVTGYVSVEIYKAFSKLLSIQQYHYVEQQNIARRCSS